VRTIIDDYAVTAQKTTSKAARSVVVYANSSLTYHFKAAVTTPLCKDELAKAAFLGADGIADQALQAVSMGDVEALAEWFLQSSDPWAASRLYEFSLLLF
jgi:hypothetical protein